MCRFTPDSTPLGAITKMVNVFRPMAVGVKGAETSPIDPNMHATTQASLTAAVIGISDGGGHSTATTSINGTINLACRCGSRAGQLSVAGVCVHACEPKIQTHTHTQSKDRGSLPRVYGSSTATDMLGTRVHQLRISKFIGMPSRRRRNCQSQKLDRVQSAYPVTPTLTD